MPRPFAASALVAIVALALPWIAVAPGVRSAPAKKTWKKPAPKPQPTIVPAATPTSTPSATTAPSSAASASSTTEEPPTTKTEAAEDVRVLMVVCPAATKLKGLEPRALVKLLDKTCRPVGLGTDEENATRDLSADDLLVVACSRSREAITPDDCGLKATLEVPNDDGAPHVLQFVAEDDALSLKTERVEKAASPANGTALMLVVEAQGQPAVRAPLAWRRGSEGYAAGRWLWFPLPMLTSDLSSSPQGYRLGVSPVAVAAGMKIFPSTTSRGYFGLSAFAAWNLLVPNDTQTLSNGTQVRINFKAVGAGALFDASGWVALGLGLGHTFTSDSRTDFRVWIYFGPRLLSFLGGG